MRKNLFILLTTWILFSLAAQADVHIIAVAGSSEKTLEPNILTMNLEVWSKASNGKLAQQYAASEYQKLKKTFEDFKIKKEDISTEAYNLNPEYFYDNKTQQNKITGYRVSQNLTVVLRKAEDAGAFIDAASAATKNNEFGVNISNLQWDSDKRAAAEMSILGEAVKDAQKKAEEIAKAAGVKIKGIYKVTHSPQPVQFPMPRGGFYKAMHTEAMAAAPTEVSAGVIKVRTEVQAEYEIN